MAAGKPHLRVTDPNEKAAKPKTISEAAEGTSLDLLRSMRRALAKRLDANEIAGNSIASAYRELRELDRLVRLAEADEAEQAATKRSGSGEFDASAV